MSKFKKLLVHLTATDLVIIGFYLILSLINIFFHSRVDEWKFFVLLNTVIISLTYYLSLKAAENKNRIWRQLHFWYVIPIVLFTFKQLYYLVYPIRQKDYDYLLIEIDRFIFGFDPTIELAAYSHPVLTELLQLIYGIFYLLPIVLVVILVLNKRKKAFDYTVFVLIYAFFLSYLGYFILPAIGPRFTLHNFFMINEELPGIFLTNALREFVNWGESIPSSVPNPHEVVQRDVFPSGHTMITLIVMYLSVRLKTKTKYLFLPVGTLLIFSTVYLWYHYVIDLIAGLIFMIVALYTGKLFYNWWCRIKGIEEFEYEKF